jgi:L-serine dehydratase
MNLVRADHISPLEIFKIGIGPSSSHTVGPMVAALQFREAALALLAERSQDEKFSLKIELFGSLSATGKGHCTDQAICAGLLALNPKASSVEEIWQAEPKLVESGILQLGSHCVVFQPETDLLFCGWTIDDRPLPHPNTMRFSLFRGDKPVLVREMLSVGGGFVDTFTGESSSPEQIDLKSAPIPVPYPYNTASEFVEVCEANNLEPWQVVVANEAERGLPEEQLRKGLKEILDTFEECIDQGLKTDGILPGGLNVRRRAKSLYEQLKSGKSLRLPGEDLKTSVYAMAVNEENAAGGRVVTAPTNGSSGLIPAVWRTLKETKELSEKTLIDGLMVAAVIGALVKVHASISGAEVGCQGEVGTSCAMAAGGATAMLGGTPRQIEQAAEMGIEHHLGMTCDPIKGLVQVPCIERNAMGAVKALNAAALSLASDGQHLISLDRALEVMKQTGLDMNQKYKETATGGLALG